MTEFTTTSGMSVKVAKKLRAHISEERRPAVIKWLRDNKHADLIKNVVSVNFGVGEDENARKLLGQLRESHGMQSAQKEEVNTTTLKSLLVALMEEGVHVPLDLFGASEHKVAVVKPVKVKKKVARKSRK